MSDGLEDGRDGSPKGPNAFRTISEVADELGLPQHVLRFWETRFPQIKPIKRGGGRRYYRPADVELLRGVKTLLYGQGYTIRGVQRILREQGGRKLAQSAGMEAPVDSRADADDERREPSVGERGFAPERAGPAASGPEIWASGRRPAAAERHVDPGGDPAVESHSYADGNGLPQGEPEGDQRPRMSSGPTESQRARLARALEELRAVRQMLDGRL